ncbi:UNVERIFIED_CONTAM: hypothetical protein HHA_266150 [Hammondia hammondi]|eukprot:XP_008888242.1 hypothetical protein HHA_266150 [Hammondia hammondi]
MTGLLHRRAPHTRLLSVQGHRSYKVTQMNVQGHRGYRVAQMNVQGHRGYRVTQMNVQGHRGYGVTHMHVHSHRDHTVSQAVFNKGRAARRQVDSPTGSSTTGGRVHQQAPGHGSGGQFPSVSAPFGLVAGPTGPPQVVHASGGVASPTFRPMGASRIAGDPPGFHQFAHVSGGGSPPVVSPMHFPGFAGGPPGFHQFAHVSGGGSPPVVSPMHFPGFAGGPPGFQQFAHVSGGGSPPVVSAIYFPGFVGGPPGPQQQTESRHGAASAPAAPAPQARGLTSLSGVPSLSGPSARWPRPFVPRGAPLGYAPSQLPPAPAIEPPWLPGALDPSRPRPRPRRRIMEPRAFDDVAVPGAGLGGPEDPDPLGLLGPSVRPASPARSPPPFAHPFLPGMGGMQGLPFGFAESQHQLISDIRRVMLNHRQSQMRGRAGPPVPPRLRLPVGIPVNPSSHLEEAYQPEPPAAGQSLDVIPLSAPLSEDTRRGVVHAQLRSLNFRRPAGVEDQVVPGAEAMRYSILHAYDIDPNFIRYLHNSGGWPLQTDLYASVPVAGRASLLALLTDRAVPNPEGFSSDED